MGGYYTFSTSAEGTAIPSFFACQVLAIEAKPILVQCYSTEQESCLSRLAIQPLDVWSREFVPTGDDVDLQVFAFADPCVKDILSLAGDYLLERWRWKAWTPKASDVEGCVLLSQPGLLLPHVPLWDKKCPVFALTDRLLADGWVAVPRQVLAWQGHSGAVRCSQTQ